MKFYECVLTVALSVMLSFLAFAYFIQYNRCVYDMSQNPHVKYCLVVTAEPVKK